MMPLEGREAIQLDAFVPNRNRNTLNRLISRWQVALMTPKDEAAGRTYFSGTLMAHWAIVTDDHDHGLVKNVEREHGLPGVPRDPVVEIKIPDSETEYGRQPEPGAQGSDQRFQRIGSSPSGTIHHEKQDMHDRSGQSPQGQR